MKKTLTAAVACALLLAPAALADVNGSIQKLGSDASSFHAVLLADGQKLMADIQSLRASKDKQAAKVLLSGDLAKLKVDLQAAHAALESDRAALKSGLDALRGSGIGKTAAGAQLKQALITLAASLASERQDVQASNQAVKQAFDALKAGLKK